MEFEDNEVHTPRSGKKKIGAKTASSFKKMITRRLSKSISSERGTGSISSAENVPIEPPTSKRFSLRSRRPRSRTKSVAERGAVTDRPRRSFSVDDMTNLEDGAEVDVGATLGPLEQEVKLPDFGDSEQFVQAVFPTNEGLVPPDTPLPEHRREQRGDTRSSSSANVSGNDELLEIDPKSVTFDDTVVQVTNAVQQTEAELAEEVKEIEVSGEGPFDYPPDADATIDAQIEQTVRESLTGAEEEKEAIITETEKETEADVPQIQDLEETRPATVEFVPEEEGDDLNPSTENVGEMDAPVIKTRELDVTDLIATEDAKEPSVTETDLTKVDDKPVSKPKRRRRLRILKSASVSLATLAVGLLIVIIKGKH